MLVLLLAGCGPAADSAAPPGAPTWHADVAPVVSTHCAGCHEAGDIGPFPLTSYAEVAAVGDAVAESVVDRRMPPWLASRECNDYRDDSSPTDDEIATIAAWVAAGMPEGDPADAVPAEPMEDTPLSRVDYTLSLPTEYTPAEAPDDYRCFAVDWPSAEGGYVTGLAVEPGNVAIVHHLVAYIAPPEQIAAYDALDAADPGPGWSCFGGPGVGVQEDAQWLGGWAPGGSRGDFPNGTGIWIDAGAKIVLQMHYNTAAATGSDQSAILLKVDPEVEFPAYVQPWANPAWLYGDSMLIPAGESGVSHGFAYTFGASNTPFRVHHATLHMHTLGRSARLWIERAGGGDECLLDLPRWDFNWQRTYVFEEPETLEAGDAIHIECTWDNPTDQDVVWGEGTGDEMCLGTMLFSR